jgi:hypothetical protein
MHRLILLEKNNGNTRNTLGVKGTGKNQSRIAGLPRAAFLGEI